MLTTDAGQQVQLSTTQWDLIKCEILASERIQTLWSCLMLSRALCVMEVGMVTVTYISHSFMYPRNPVTPVKLGPITKEWDKEFHKLTMRHYTEGLDQPLWWQEARPHKNNFYQSPPTPSKKTHNSRNTSFGWWYSRNYSSSVLTIKCKH